MVKTITFEEILPVWTYHLWPDRVTPIEPNSAMCYLGGYDMFNMQTDPTFFAYYVDDKIAGVNSGHMCKDQHYRSRGLFVFDEFRKMGIGTSLLQATLEQGKKEGAVLCWSYPRDTSWNAYSKAGFEKSSEYFQGETGNNCYCIYNY